MKIDARYMVAKANKNGTVRYYWQRRGFFTRRLPDDEIEAVREAKALNAKADAEALAPVDLGPAPGTIAWAIAEYRASARWLNLSSTTRRVYERWMIKTEKQFGARSLTKLDPGSVDEMLGSIKSLGGKKHCAAVLQAIGKIAYRRGYRPTNPAMNLEIGRGKPRDQIWSKENEAAFLKACQVDLHGVAMGLAFLLMVDTAQRPGDLLRLTWASYDGTSLSLVQQKTGKRVEVDCTERLKAALDAAKAKRDRTLIVADRKGQRLTYGTFNKAFRRICEAAKIEGLQARDLRRTAVVRMAEAGALPQEVAAVTGHSLGKTMAILETYMPRTKKMQRAAIAKLERAK
ncbi:MAG: site-specific integrase [Pseudomonadota bacterium]